MKRTRYTKFNGDFAGGIGLDDLMEALSDFLLDSGFHDPWSEFQELNGDHSMENLREAIKQVMESGDFLDEDAQQQYDDMNDDQREQMLDSLVERMQQGDYIQQQEGEPSEMQGQTEPGEIAQPAPPQGEARFHVTDKSMDFLSYKSLRDLLGGMGRSMSGRHDTRYEASGIEASGSSKQYGVWRCDEPGRKCHALQRHAARGALCAVECGVQRSCHPPERVPVVMRDSGDAGLFALHDPVWRGPVHTGQARCHGVVASDPHTVPWRLAAPGAVP